VSARTPILEVGGTHVTAAWVEQDGWRVNSVNRSDLDAQATAADLIAAFVAPAARLNAPADAHWGVAMPGPFDYAHGVGLYEGVGKFDSLNGVDVRTALADALPNRPGSISFINDASAYLVGEWLAGAAIGADSCAILTLGTGIGSAFLRNGKVIDSGPEVPPDGEVHLLEHAGRPLEDWISRRAIRRSYAEASGASGDLDVQGITELARAGDSIARTVIEDAFVLLGQTVGPWLWHFDTQVLVVGGSISRSWDLIEDPLTRGLAECVQIVRLAEDTEHAPLIGAAYPALTRGS
jgi:glucokinase